MNETEYRTGEWVGTATMVGARQSNVVLYGWICCLPETNCIQLLQPISVWTCQCSVILTSSINHRIAQAGTPADSAVSCLNGFFVYSQASNVPILMKTDLAGNQQFQWFLTSFTGSGSGGGSTSLQLWEDWCPSKLGELVWV